jgi:NAD(P)-dependent dehydrogenase (short-subunit alcohol dehydrogenase family)/acetyltransferase-like isoleucine patch superfamily enzyme
MNSCYTIEELKSKGITVRGKNISISKYVNIYNPQNLILHDNIRIDDFTVISCKGTVEIFNYVHIGCHCLISCSTKIVFGNYTGISSGVKLFGGCDDFSGDFLTNPTVPTKYSNVSCGDIILENHVLIGANSLVLPNVILKEGTSVAALSLIKKDTEPWKIYGGCPAKVLKDRHQNCLILEKKLEAENKIIEPQQTVNLTLSNDIISTSKTIFITGGSKGIGKEIAVFFKNLNYNVIISYNKSFSNTSELTNKGIHVYKMDVTNEEECAEVIKNIIHKFKKIDVLVNNAGIIENSLFHKMTSEQWNSVINTNLNSLFNVTHCVIQNMLEHKQGKIINISSIYGLKGSKGQTNYSSSKHGVIGFTKSLALEYSDSNILVNCICPGLVKTDMFNNINAKITEKIINSNPIKKVIEPYDIAKACDFLVNCDYCTGTILNLDCGMNC